MGCFVRHLINAHLSPRFRSIPEYFMYHFCSFLRPASRCERVRRRYWLPKTNSNSTKKKNTVQATKYAAGATIMSSGGNLEGTESSCWRFNSTSINRLQLVFLSLSQAPSPCSSPGFEESSYCLPCISKILLLPARAFSDVTAFWYRFATTSHSE